MRLNRYACAAAVVSSLIALPLAAAQSAEKHVFVSVSDKSGAPIGGLTATGVTRLGSKVEQFELLRDGLEACRSRSHPGCRKLRQRFWDMMQDVAADVSVRPVSGSLT